MMLFTALQRFSTKSGYGCFRLRGEKHLTHAGGEAIPFSDSEMTIGFH